MYLLAGEGYIRSDSAESVGFGVTRWNDPSISGRKGTRECWKDITSAGCACNVDLPRLFTRGRSSLYQQTFVPAVIVSITLDRDTPGSVQEAIKKMLATPMYPQAAACIKHSTTVVALPSARCFSTGAKNSSSQHPDEQ
jgi:hypothetical protein